MKPNYFLLSPAKTLFFALFCTVFLFGCQSKQPKSQNNQPGSNKPIYSVEPQNLANGGQSIMLARDLIRQGEVSSAIQILKPFKLDQLALNEQQLYVLARSELAIARNDIEEALFWISGKYTKLFERASKNNQLSLRFLRSDVASKQHDYLTAARERIFIDDELIGEQKQNNHDQIWKNLLKISVIELEEFLKISKGAYGTLDLVGWLKLAYTIQNVKAQVYLQQNKLQTWLASNQGHPAAKMLPSPLVLLTQALQNQPKQIAVLVTMTGKFAIVGHSIQAGLLAQYYNVTSNKQAAPILKFYDTSVANLNIIDMYNQAVADGAEFVIGPFLDKAVNDLANYADISIPVLFLRSTTHTPLVPEKTLQIDLSLNHEAARIAVQAYADGHRNAAIINTKNSKGRQGFADIFEKTFTGLGGTVVAKTHLDTSVQASTGRTIKYIVPVKELMGIDGSEQRARAVFNIIDEPISNFEVRPRRDIDMIFMAVSQTQSVRLKPIFNQQYAQQIPFYVMSEIYSGGQLPKQYDFNNMRLQAMPWNLQGVTHNDLPQYDEIANTYQANEVSMSISALGIDAYNIMLQFEIFKRFVDNIIPGATGMLYQAGDGVIHTKRDWIIINNNKISIYDITE